MKKDVRLLMMTAGAQQQQQDVSPNNDATAGSIAVKVNLDASRLRGKWQTLCIDLDKIIGNKLGNINPRLELQRMSITAPESFLSEITSTFVPYFITLP
jgi:hypothetical protein